MENNILVNDNSKEIIKDILFQESCEVNLKDGQKLLGTTARSRLSGCEALENELRISITTTFRIVVCDENNEISTETIERESLKTINHEGIAPTSKICLKSHTTECEKSGINPVKLIATIEICGWFVKSEELTFLNVCNDNIYCKSEKYTIENVIPLSDNTLNLSYTDEARMPLTKILDYSGSATIDRIYPESNGYRAEGELIIRVLAVTDNGQYITQNFSHPFTAENAEEGLGQDMRIDGECELKSLSFTITESDKRLMVCDATIKIYGVAIQEQEIEKAADVYSVTHEIELVTTSKKVNTNFCLRSIREKAGATLTVPSGMNEILGVVTPCTTIADSDSQNINGIISTDIIYLDENNIPSSIHGEIPFSGEIGEDYPCETIFSPEVIISSISARPRGGKDIEVNAELIILIRGVQSKEITIISDVKIGVEKEEDNIAIGLYISKEGETLWEVAKALNTDELTLAEQNPDMQLPLKGGEKIILYKQLAEL